MPESAPRRLVRSAQQLLLTDRGYAPLTALTLVGEAALTALIIYRVPCACRDR